VNKENLESIFRDLRNYLDEMDKLREKILPIQRLAVRQCSEIIKRTHRKEFTSLVDDISAVKARLAEIKHLITEANADLTKDYVQIVQQELGEAIILYYVIVKDQFPTLEECSIDLPSYAYALCDAIGEIRRYVLHCIQSEDQLNAQRGLDYMEEIYSQLFTLDYPSGLIPGLRNKVDQARNIIAKTEGDVALSMNLLKLNANLKKNQ
jgi:predicted translin family RNA/ssDNA-binding protein